MNRSRWIAGGVVVMLAVAVTWAGCGGDTEETPPGGAGGAAGAAGAAGAGGGAAGDGGAAGKSGAAGAAGDAGPKDTGPDTKKPDVGPDISYYEGSISDMSVPDVPIGDTGATLPGCYGCAQSKCGSELGTCDKDPKCKTLFACAMNSGCLGKGFDQSALMCLAPCLYAVGLDPSDIQKVISDPAVQMLYGFAQCLGQNCGKECGAPSDAGPPGDGPKPDQGGDAPATDSPASETSPDSPATDATPAEGGG